MMTPKEKRLFEKLMKFSKRYQLSLQMWPDVKAVFIAKDHVDLTSFGTDSLEEVMRMAVEYLERINKVRPFPKEIGPMQEPTQGIKKIPKPGWQD